MYKKVWCRGELFFLLLIKAPSTRIRWKRSPKTHLFKDASFSSTCRRTDGIGGFRVRWCHTSYTTSITHVLWGCYRYFHHFSVFMWTGENDSNTQSVDAYFFFFLENGGKKSPFSNISGYVWTQPVITGALNILKQRRTLCHTFFKIHAMSTKHLEKSTAIIRQKYNKNNMILLTINISCS